VTDVNRRSFLSIAGAAGIQPLLSGSINSALSSGLWDYVSTPVQVENPDVKEDWHTGAKFAFDGYGGSVHPNSLSHCWVQEGVPSESKPFFCTLDYGRPISVTGFAHYFYNPDVKDYRADALLLSTAFRSVNLYVSRDRRDWKLIETWRDIVDMRPQVLRVSNPTAARYYKIEIVGLVPGAAALRTYQIETYTDSSFKNIQPQRCSLQNPSGRPNTGVSGQVTVRGRLHDGNLEIEWSLVEGAPSFSMTPAQGAAAIAASLDISYNNEPLKFEAFLRKDASLLLRSRQPDDSLECEVRLQGSALRLEFHKYSDGSKSGPGVLAAVLKADGVKFRFIPAYVYSSNPIREMLPGVYGEQSRSTTIGAWQSPTRMAALETSHGTLAVVPDRDRCLIGIDGDDAVVRQRLGNLAVEISIVVVAGNWFDSFLHVADSIYHFERPRQFAPLVETATREMKYLAHNPGVWSEKMRVITSFPRRDYVYVLYGLTYSIPALYSWYRMSGDRSARERAEASVRWLLEYPGVRVLSGPLAGAFYSQYVAPEMDGRPLFDGPVASPMAGIGGGDQADNRWIEPHATGAAVCTLLHYYVASGKQDQAPLRAAKNGLDWLMRIQKSNGGWIYAYHDDGSPVTDEEDAGNIWNIWALWRYGSLTGEKQYQEAAERGREWFAQKFLSQHIGRGYWEDVSGARGRVRLSWESYELAVATIVFDEMGASDLALEAARNAVTWIWTRTVACRDYFNSYGHAHEQWGWPPATYVAPMFGLAAQIAYRISGDERFHRFAGSAKTPGWWVVRNTANGIWPAEANAEELGGAIWPLEATEFIPLEEPFTITYWVDWISAQQSYVCVKWLLNEISRRTGGKVHVDSASLAGTVLDDPGELYLRPEELDIRGSHGEINWLGFRSAKADTLVILNDYEPVVVEVGFRRLAEGSVKILSSSDGKEWISRTSHMSNRLSIEILKNACAVVIRER
jgi:hypothetical protein